MPFAAVALALFSSILLVPSAQAATNYTDADILQFALNLEVHGFYHRISQQDLLPFPVLASSRFCSDSVHPFRLCGLYRARLVSMPP